MPCNTYASQYLCSIRMVNSFKNDLLQIITHKLYHIVTTNARELCKVSHRTIIPQIILQSSFSKNDR